MWIFLAVLIVASMGPSLHVAGHEGNLDAGEILGTSVPILPIALPGRASSLMYAFLGTWRLIVAMWFCVVVG